MIDKLLVSATAKSVEEILSAAGVPYEFKQDEEKDLFDKEWSEADDAAKEQAMTAARAAMKRIMELEPYAFGKGGDALIIRYNYLKRKLDRDSFGELLLERPDADWHVSVSIKNDADVLSSLKVADRTRYYNNGEIVNVFNEIDDFGDRIFGIPCSNEYFNDMNNVLLSFEPYQKPEWLELLQDDNFLYGKLITPMLKAIGAEYGRLCKSHPEIPRKLFEYFYGDFDYYFIKPIEELKLTRIGAVNPRGQLGRIPGSHNLYVPQTALPKELADVRLATGKYGEISNDTLQITFTGGWSFCIRLYIDKNHLEERNFKIKVYMPSLPFGSYRDQAEWE